MDFKVINRIKFNKKPILYWFLFVFVLPSFAISTDKLKETYRDFSGAKGISFNRLKKFYHAVSATRGESEDLFQVKDKKARELKSFSEGNIALSLLSYDEFFQQTQPLLQKIKHLDKLPHALSPYMQLLSVDVEEFNINVTFIASPLSLFYESKERKVSKIVTLDFIENLNPEQIENFAGYIGKGMTGTLAHESFHFFVAYANYPKMPELREEVYAHLFGKCVNYEIDSQITTGFNIEPYPKDFYQDMKKELKGIRKATKKRGYFKSLQAELIAMYYFRYILDDHFSPIIQSNKIPQFCHKLFSEHNFKHPVEKKPPKWFNGFLKRKQKA